MKALLAMLDLGRRQALGDAAHPTLQSLAQGEDDSAPVPMPDRIAVTDPSLSQRFWDKLPSQAGSATPTAEERTAPCGFAGSQV